MSRSPAGTQILRRSRTEHGDALPRAAASTRFRSIRPSSSSSTASASRGQLAGFAPAGRQAVAAWPAAARRRGRPADAALGSNRSPAPGPSGRRSAWRGTPPGCNRRRRPPPTTDQVVDVAVQNEEAGRAGEIQIGQLPRPGRTPGGQRSRRDGFGGIVLRHREHGLASQRQPL